MPPVCRSCCNSYQVCVTVNDACAPSAGVGISGATVTVKLSGTTVGTCTTNSMGVCCVPVSGPGVYTATSAKTGYYIASTSTVTVVSGTYTASTTVTLAKGDRAAYSGTNLNLNIGGANYTLYHQGAASWSTSPNGYLAAPYATYTTTNGVATGGPSTCTTHGSATASFDFAFNIDSSGCALGILSWWYTSCSDGATCVVIDNNTFTGSYSGPLNVTNSGGMPITTFTGVALDVVFAINGPSTGTCATPVPFVGTNATVTP